MPLTGFLVARLRRKRVFMWSVAGFTVASMLCGAAAEPRPDRALPAAPGRVRRQPGAPVAIGAARHLSARAARSAMALWGVGVMVGPILGPSLGGWLTEYYNWRWVFYINLPVGLLAWFGLAALSSRDADRPRRAASTCSALRLLSLGIGALQMMLDRGQSRLVRSSTEIMRRGDDRRPRASICSSSTCSPTSSLPRAGPVQGPQLQRRPAVHLHRRRHPVRDHGAAAADSCRT